MKSRILVTWIVIGGFFLLTDLAYARKDMSFGKLKSAACTDCHGLNGISPSSLIPNLAGQDEEYIVSQLKAFKSGRRISDVMQQISESLTNGEIISLASYYSRQAIEIVNDGDPLLIKKGRDKYYSLCWSCHGENGEGPGSYPVIAGQYSQYTVQQLKNFKYSTRINPAMKVITSDLNSDDMEALGAYIGSLNPNKHQSTNRLVKY